MAESHLIRFASGGVNQSTSPSLIQPQQAWDMVNCVIWQDMVGCRPGVVLHDLEVQGAIQGAIFYNPAEGQSQQAFADDEASMMLACGGFKYQIKVSDDHPENTKVTVEDVTNGLQSNPDYHMVWMIQAESYVIAQDGNSDTWIWDGETTAFTSTGYNTEDKPDSKLANGASILAYAHGRVVQVIDGKKVLVGDILHKSELFDPSNILGTTEQTYWATGSFFSPPSELGPVQAMAILPLQNTQHGHADLILHCKNGAFSIDISIYPRSEWVTRAISKHVLADTGAAGFYALTTYEGDQIFLSRHGVQSLRSEASVNKLGNSFEPISEPVRNYTRTDDRRLLTFASMSKSVERRRLLVTTGHMIQDASHRGGRGILVLNFQPKTGGSYYSWEGLWTLPSQGFLVGNLVRGVFGSGERLFAFVTGTDSSPRLAEFSEDLTYDVLPDGTLKPIQWQVVTRADTMGDEVSSKIITNAAINWKRCRGEVKFTVYGRNERTPWTMWNEGCINAGDECCLSPDSIRDFRYDLGSPPDDLKKSQWIQLLVKVTGPAFIETIRLKSTIDKGGEMGLQETCVSLADLPNCDDIYQPFEYSNP